MTDWSTYIDDTVERSDPEEIGKSDFTLDLDRALEQFRISELGDLLTFHLANGAEFNAAAIGYDIGNIMFFIADSSGEMHRVSSERSALNSLRNFIITEMSSVASTKRY